MVFRENREYITHKTRHLHFNNYGQDILKSANPKIVNGLFMDVSRKQNNLLNSWLI